jgi:excisionase family DNA binding protein
MLSQPNSTKAAVPERPCSLKESVDLKTASRLTSIPYSTLRQWIAQGDLPAYIVNGRRIRVYVEDLQRLYVPVGEARR